MSLAELMAGDPAVAQKVEALKAEAFKSGALSVQAVVDQVVPYLTNEKYGAEIQALACQVLKGDVNVAALQAGVTVHDALKAKDETVAAVGESKKLPATPPDGGADLSTDGILRTEDDMKAEVERLRATA